ncbi:SRPBCC family protein [Streptomyces doebereineriae]|uniref:SRPBCC family protein n=1 Tax=Streptomyces doebereineriae TaxID=3075528 RepID=A0ABU2VFN7_9ACTN|nr:SRPBCC family protein [Streptomyces sp. DSM 41640]MDT0484386.1 SRPBCC family protein [Streptomyces sp. DSM 41640]
MWKVLTDFAGYAQWHPDLSFVDVPTEVRPGTVLRARLSTGSEIDGEYDFTVLHYEAPRRLAWEGGIPGVVTGDHSFLLDPMTAERATRNPRLSPARPPWKPWSPTGPKWRRTPRATAGP